MEWVNVRIRGKSARSTLQQIKINCNEKNSIHSLKMSCLLPTRSFSLLKKERENHRGENKTISLR